METNVYQKQALDFLEKTGTKMEIKFLKTGYHFADDKKKDVQRDIYAVTIMRESRKIYFEFGNSIYNSGFYVTIGKNKYPIERKYLEKSNTEIERYIKNTIKFDYIFKLDSIHYPKAPNEYDILACLQKYDVGTFEDFCSDFGYDEDSITANKTYQAVCNEFKDVQTIWTDEEIELLQEID